MSNFKPSFVRRAWGVVGLCGLVQGLSSAVYLNLPEDMVYWR